VSDEVYVPGKSQVAREILAYLADHPDAQDTLDGIIEWWLLERKTIYQKKIVKEALEELVRRNLLLEYQGKDSIIYYHTNLKKFQELDR
jgi:hypothetical protein